MQCTTSPVGIQKASQSLNAGVQLWRQQYERVKTSPHCRQRVTRCNGELQVPSPGAHLGIEEHVLAYGEAQAVAGGLQRKSE